MLRTPLLMLTEGAFRHASSRTRALAYGPLLAAAGYDVTHVARRPDRGPLGAVGVAVGKRVNALQRALAVRQAWPLVLVQRFGAGVADVQRLQARGAKVVFDFDDAIFIGMGLDEAAGLVRFADRVVVSTPALLPFCEKHRRPGDAPTLVLPTPVEADRLTPAPAPPDVFTVGWIGSAWTTKYLVPLAPVLVEVARTRRIAVRLVGADAAQLPPMPGVDVQAVPWRFAAEADELRRMSVGVMPLPDDPWAAGKGAYKLYQYFAAGLPVVASPVGLNADVVRDADAGAPDSNGLLATTPDDWRAALVRLMDDPALSRRLGAAGRADALARYDRPVVGARLLDVLRDLAPPSSAEALHATGTDAP